MIEKGDRVTVCMTTNHAFLFQRGHGRYIENAMVLHRPIGEGDCFEFRTEDGIEFGLNPYCSEFAGVQKQAPTEAEGKP